MHYSSNTSTSDLAAQIANQHFDARQKDDQDILDPLPSPSAVRALVDDLSEIVLLREGPRASVDRAQLTTYIETLLGRIRPLFRGQMEREIPRSRSENLLEAFLTKLPRIASVVRSDIEATLRSDPAALSADYVRLSYPGVWAVAVYRIAHEVRAHGMHIIARLMSEYAHERTGIDIHPGAQIGERFFIDHGTGIVIGETAVIGSNVAIYQGVTLGAQAFPRAADGSFDVTKKRHPTIGDNVTIYAHAVIVGSAKVEDGSIVGSGARLVLKENLPAATKVLPPRQQLRFSGPNITDDISASS